MDWRVAFNVSIVQLVKQKKNLKVVPRFKSPYHLSVDPVKQDLGLVLLKYSMHRAIHVTKVDTIQFLVQVQNKIVCYVL